MTALTWSHRALSKATITTYKDKAINTTKLKECEMFTVYEGSINEKNKRPATFLTAREWVLVTQQMNKYDSCVRNLIITRDPVTNKWHMGIDWR